MILNIIVLVILILWIIIYVKNKKAILSLPYLLMIFFTPVYNILAVAITILGIVLSKKIESKKIKIIYILTILAFNILLAYKIWKLCMWA